MNDILLFLFILFGLIFGSFGTVIITRVPEKKGIGGRSQCPKCKRTLSFFELIPVISFLLQGGVCRYCRKRIHWLYPFVECTTVAVFLMAFWLTGSSYHFLDSFLLAFLFWILLLIAFIDARTQLIPDVLNIPFVFGSVLYAFFFGHFDILAIAAVGGFFGIQWVLSWGSWIGGGDILMAMGIALLLGSLEITIYWIGLSYFIGAVVVLYLLATGKKSRKDHIAFAPFLIIGFLLALLLERFILDQSFLY